MAKLLQKNKFGFASLTAAGKRKLIEEEFAKLLSIDARTWRNSTYRVANSTENRDKNRYFDVLPTDACVWPPKDSGIYIGGSSIPRTLLSDELRVPHEFVAACAPIPQNFGSWWAAIQNFNCGIILMLTREMEKGMVKADRYWPDAPGCPLDVVEGSVKILSEDRPGLFIINRVLEFTPLSGSGKPHVVKHLQYTGWPDHGVPDTADDLLALVGEVQHSDPSRPVFVHCSAGIGRTGTFVAVYHAMWLASQGRLDDKSLFGIVSKLKERRCGMVQAREQYAFAYAAVARFLAGRREQ